MCHLCGPLLPLYIILFIQSGRCSMLWVFVLPWLSFLLCFLPWSSYIHSLYEYIASSLCSFYLFFFFVAISCFPFLFMRHPMSPDCLCIFIDVMYGCHLWERPNLLVLSHLFVWLRWIFERFFVMPSIR